MQGVEIMGEGPLVAADVVDDEVDEEVVVVVAGVWEAGLADVETRAMDDEV